MPLQQKPAVRPEYLKGQIIEHQGKLFESLQRADGSYVWHMLSSSDSIDEGGMSVFTSDEEIGRQLKAMLDEMRSNVNYRFSNVDYDTFHEFRARFPKFYNDFLRLYKRSSNKEH